MSDTVTLKLQLPASWPGFTEGEREHVLSRLAQEAVSAHLKCDQPDYATALRRNM